MISLPDRARIPGAHLVVEHRAASIGGQGIENTLLDGRTSRNKHFEYRQRRRNRDVVLNEIEDRVVQWAALYIQLGDEVIVGFLGTLPGFFPGIEFRVHKQTMFQIVDANGGSFTKADGAKMSGNFSAPLVSGVHGSRQFGWSDEHVRFEIIDALVEPEINGLGCVVRSSELMHLHRKSARSFQIRPSHVDLRTRRLSPINLPLEFKVGVRFERSRGANGGHSSGKIQTREAERHLAEDPISHGVKEMIVHADQAGDDTVAVQVEHLGILGNIRRRAVGDRLDLSFRNDDGLVFPRGRARAVNHAHMGQRHDGSIDRHKAAHVRREGLGNKSCRPGEYQQQAREKFAHDSSFRNHRAGFYRRNASVCGMVGAVAGENGKTYSGKKKALSRLYNCAAESSFPLTQKSATGSFRSCRRI